MVFAKINAQRLKLNANDIITNYFYHKGCTLKVAEQVLFSCNLA